MGCAPSEPRQETASERPGNTRRRGAQLTTGQFPSVVPYGAQHIGSNLIQSGPPVPPPPPRTTTSSTVAPRGLPPTRRRSTTSRPGSRDDVVTPILLHHTDSSATTTSYRRGSTTSQLRSFSSGTGTAQGSGSTLFRPPSHQSFPQEFEYSKESSFESAIDFLDTEELPIGVETAVSPIVAPVAPAKAPPPHSL